MVIGRCIVNVSMILYNICITPIKKNVVTVVNLTSGTRTKDMRICIVTCER